MAGVPGLAGAVVSREPVGVVRLGLGAYDRTLLFRSHTGPNEGTLEVFPNITLTTAGILLRPFFSFKLDPATATRAEVYNPDNWNFDVSTSAFPNSAMGRAQEMNKLTHPHLSLEYGMTSIPKVAPYVLLSFGRIHSLPRGLADTPRLLAVATPSSGMATASTPSRPPTSAKANPPSSTSPPCP